jgi:beta-glucosidase/6-phospho-beta-glucosidase/beta-galactosidase
MNREILPDRLTRLLLRLSRDYPGLPLVVTENGAAFHDEPDKHGFVADKDRAEHVAEHIRAVAAVRPAGGPTSAGTSCGRCSTTSRGRTGTTSGSASSG